MIDYLHRKWRALGTLRRSGTIGRLSVPEVAEHLGKPGFFVFDANWRSLWRRGHVPGAAHVEYDRFGIDALPEDRAATLLFYCHNAF